MQNLVSILQISKQIYQDIKEQILHWQRVNTSIYLYYDVATFQFINSLFTTTCTKRFHLSSSKFLTPLYSTPTFRA